MTFGDLNQFLTRKGRPNTLRTSFLIVIQILKRGVP